MATALGLAAKDRATILADEIVYERGGNELSAAGNVEVYFQGRLLQTRSLQYRQGNCDRRRPDDADRRDRRHHCRRIWAA